MHLTVPPGPPCSPAQALLSKTELLNSLSLYSMHSWAHHCPPHITFGGLFLSCSQANITECMNTPGCRPSTFCPGFTSSRAAGPEAVQSFRRRVRVQPLRPFLAWDSALNSRDFPEALELPSSCSLAGQVARTTPCCLTLHSGHRVGLWDCLFSGPPRQNLV